MQYAKSAVVVLVAVMLAFVAVPVMAEDNEATDATSYGEFSIWIYDGAATVTPVTVEGYNAYLALKNLSASENISITYAEGAENYIYDAGGYLDINADYGTVATINGSDSFTIYCYVNGEWTEAMDALGFYRPFDDYDTNFATANIIIVIGTNEPDEFPTNVLSLVDVPQNSDEANASDFAVTFHLKISSACIDDYYGSGEYIPDLIEGITLTGYGSDVYLALKNAVANHGYTMTGYDDVSYISTEGETCISTMYGYVSDLLGLEYTVIPGTPYYTYYYWSTYLGNSNETDYNNMCLFMFGYYSPLSEVPESSSLCANEFTLIYCYS